MTPDEPENEQPFDVAAEIKSLRERIAHLESMAHNEHSLPAQTIEHIISQALVRMHSHLAKTHALGKVLLEEQD